MKKLFLGIFVIIVIALTLCAFRGWKTGGSSVWFLGVEVPYGDTYTDALYIKNSGTTTNGINLEGTYTADIKLQSGDTIANTAAGTVSYSGSISVGDDLTVNSVDAAGSGSPTDYNGAFKFGFVGTPLAVDATSVVSDQIPIQVDMSSVANPAFAQNMIGAYLKTSAITADQANSTLVASRHVVDVDMLVDNAYGIQAQMTRNGDKDVTGSLVGVSSTVDMETGAAMTCDVYGLTAEILGTNATSGTAAGLYVKNSVNVDDTAILENATGKTVTNVLLIDNDGTNTNGIYIDSAGTSAAAIHINGTHTVDLSLQSGNTIANGAAGTITIDSDVDATGGYQHQLTSWYQDNVVANQAAVVLNMDGNASRAEVPSVKAGSIIGIAVYSNEARTAGTLTVDATIDGSVTGLQAVLDVTNTQTHTATQARAADAFTAGQRIGIKITTDAGWLPVTADITAVVLVEQ